MNDNRISISELGKRISYLRKKKLLTQKELGNRLDISDKTISKWEKGTVAPDITILVNLAKVLEIKLDDLLVVNNEEMKTKRKRTISSYLMFLILLCVILLSGFFYYKEKESNKWIAYELVSLNDQYLVEGYILSNDVESRIVFTRLAYKLESFEIYSIKTEIYCNDELVYDADLNDEKGNINNYLFLIKDKLIINLKKFELNELDDMQLYIKFIYKDKKSKEHNRIIELGLN